MSAKIADIEKYLNSVNKNLLEDLCKQSMVVLKDKLARKYEGNSSRKTFSEDNLWKEPYDVLAEYPVILSTTFSSRNSLNSDDGEVDLGNATTDEVTQVAWMNREQIKELFDANMFVDTLEYFFTEVGK